MACTTHTNLIYFSVFTKTSRPPPTPWNWPHRKANQSIRRCHPYDARKSASQAVLSSMQLTLHAPRRTPHTASRLVLAMSASSVKTRRAPSQHCRDAWVHGHTTTAMHDNEYPPHLPPTTVRALHFSYREKGY